MRIILDTNVLVSGIFWGGIPGKIIAACLNKELTLVASTDIVDEYLRVIKQTGAKFKTIDTEPIINMILLETQIHEEIIVPLSLCRDFDDEKFITAGLSAGVHHIVSGDKDLLECKNLPKSLEVINPSEFYKKHLA